MIDKVNQTVPAALAPSCVGILHPQFLYLATKSLEGFAEFGIGREDPKRFFKSSLHAGIFSLEIFYDLLEKLG
jgi:hypothetical protein